MNLSIKPHQYIFLGFLTQTLNKTKANTPTQRFRTQWALWYLTTSAMVRNSRYSRSDYFPLITAITESHSTNLRWMCSEWYSFIVMFIICLYDIIWYYMINLYRFVLSFFPLPNMVQTCSNLSELSDPFGFTEHQTSRPMTDPWCWYINANIKGVYWWDPWHTIYIAAPLGSVMGNGFDVPK